MSTEYLGKTVQITLNEPLSPSATTTTVTSFLVISGIIESINQQSNTLILVNVNIGPKRYSRMEVCASQIGAMEIIPQTTPSQTTQTTNTGNPKKKKKERKVKEEDINIKMDTFTKEFDFQANLNLFPKNEIFSELRAADNIPINQRLVGHNLSQSKFRHDEMILGRVDDHEVDEDEEIFISSPQPSLPPTPKKAVTLKSGGFASTPLRQPQKQQQKDIDYEKIERMVLDEYCSIEQLIHYCSQSSYFAVKDFIEKDGRTFNTLLVRYSNDSLGAIALNCGRLLLDRFPDFQCSSSSSDGDGLVPSYIKTSLRQWQLWGGSAIDDCKVDSGTLVLDSQRISSSSSSFFSTGKVVRFRKDGDGDLNLRFGVPHSVGGGNRSSDRIYVLCNAGYPRMALTEYNNLLKDSLFERI